MTVRPNSTDRVTDVRDGVHELSFFRSENRINRAALHLKGISTIDHLVLELRKPGARSYLDILRMARIPLTQWQARAQWNGKRYTRTCIAQNREFELLLIAYEPGQRTSIHDYDSTHAWVHPLMGELTEERYELAAEGHPVLTSSVVLHPDSFSYLTRSHSIHRYVNTGEGRALSLNLYSAPLRQWKVYDERGGMRQERVI
ncbi:MAG: cysteine dioxygenase family protein [Flavobacteriales bacterium]|nr:cysteine dioxygenase family protein [Flavobacteriales bacterium]